MAFDQYSIPKDLRPLNTVRTVHEDPLVAPATTTSAAAVIAGGTRNPEFLPAPDGSLPAFYLVSDAGFGYGSPVSVGASLRAAPLMNVGVGNPGLGGVGYSSNLGSRVVGSNAGNETAAGLCSSSSLVNRVNGNAGDELISSGVGDGHNLGNHGSGGGFGHGSEEGGEDFVSARKVKFLCSFGGNIMPRPSDGVLRYVGGQTKIIGVRRDVSFNELARKMMDTCAQTVVIRYQLPDEDLDALVSVSCPEDLENMIDEYDKLVERSPDGSAKLRVFLFSAAELDAAGVFHLEDSNYNTRKYVDALNGYMDGGGITRKESLDSATSNQNSDFSGTESGGFGPGKEEATVTLLSNTLTHRGDVTTPHDATPKLVPVGPSPPVYVGTSLASISVPMLKTGPLESSPRPEIELERPMVARIPQQQQSGYDVQLPPAGKVAPMLASYMQTYVNPRQEIVNHVDCTHIPPQMGLTSAHLLGTCGPVFRRQNIPGVNSSIASHQFIPAVHITPPPPSSLVAIRPTIVQPPMQSPQTWVEQYPDENTSGTRIVQVPINLGHSVYQAQVMPSVVGGAYGWQHVPQQEHVVISDGCVPPKVVVIPEKNLPLNDCHMCQKALPHGHSDPIVHDQRESSTSLSSSASTVHQSLPVVLNQLDRLVGIPNTTGVPHQVIGLQGDLQPQYGFLSGPIPQPGIEVSIQQHKVPIHFEVKQDGAISRPSNYDSLHVGVPVPVPEYQLHESPKEHPGKLPHVGSRENVAVDTMMETLHMVCPEVNAINKLKLSPIDNCRTEEILEGRNAQNVGREVVLDSAPIKPHVVLPVLTEVPLGHNSRPIEPYELAQQAISGDPILYPQFNTRVGQPESHAFTGAEAADVITRILLDEPKYDVSHIQPISSPVDAEVVPLNAGPPTILSISRVGDVLGDQDSNSLFSNQDPWNLRHESHFPPPRPNIITTRGEGFAMKDSFMDSHSNKNFSSGNSEPSKGSAEEIIKQELQATAEGVAASVLELNTHNSDSTMPEKAEFTLENQNKEDSDNKDIKKNPSEKANYRFPATGDIGHLQIINNRDLEELSELGSGTFGTVYHGKWRGTDVAIKRINDRCFAGGKPSEHERMLNDFWNEAIKLAELHHPNVVAFYGIVLDGPGGSVATVTEFMVNGSLRDALQTRERSLDKRKRLMIAMDVAFGMEYLHGKKIVHFDLKSDNLLVNLGDTQRPICKVGDLGLSKVKCRTLISGGVRGTLPWMAPELLNGSGNLVSEKVDVFSFGIVLWELLTGEEPYSDLHYGAIIGGIVSNTLRPPIPETCDPNWRSLMERCWSAETSDRPSFTEIAWELQAMAAKIPPKARQQPPPTTLPQVP